MPDALVTTQACGCISLPDEVMTLLGIGPRSELRLSVDVARGVLLLARTAAASGDGTLERSSCPVPR